MKRLHYFLFAIVLFMSFTTGVEASTICKYHYDDIEFTLETTDDDNVLDKVTEDSSNLIKYKIFGDGIELDNGNCPSVSFYDSRAIIPIRRIYASRNQCIQNREAFISEDMCSENVSGTRDTSGESSSSSTGQNLQFTLVGSSGEVCNYNALAVDADDNEVYIDYTVTKDGDSLITSCRADNNTPCNAEMESHIENRILNNGNFTCPVYLYSEDVRFQRVITVNIVDSGTDADEQRDPDSSAWERPNAIGSSNWNQPIDCPTLFSNEPGSVGNILRTILGYIRVIGPILVVLLSAIDFIKAIFGFDEKAMGNAYRKLIIRLIAAIALFLIPTLIDVMLDFINATTCTLE